MPLADLPDARMAANGESSTVWGGLVLTGFYGGLAAGSLCELVLYGHKDDVLALANTLDAAAGGLDLQLRTDTVGPRPFAGRLTALRVEVAREGGLLVEQEGSVLSVNGAKDSLRALARDIRQAAQTTHKSPVGGVQVELRREPYMDSSSGSLAVEVYDPAYEKGG